MKTVWTWTGTDKQTSLKYNEERLGFPITGVWSIGHSYQKDKVFFIPTSHRKHKSITMGSENKMKYNNAFRR